MRQQRASRDEATRAFENTYYAERMRQHVVSIYGSSRASKNVAPD